MAKRIYARTLSTGRNNEVIQQMQNAADRLLKQFQDDLAKAVMNQTQQATADISSSEIDAIDNSGDGVGLASFTTLIGAAAKYIFAAKPKTSTQETSHSAAAQQQFRLSQSQAAALASAQLAKGQKNS